MKTPHFKLRSQLTPIACLLATLPAHGAWTLLDDFDGYSTGPTTTATGGTWTSVWDGTANSNIVSSGSGNALQALGGAAWRGAERDLTGTPAAITVDEIQTYYWQVQVGFSQDNNGTGWNYDFMMGLAPTVASIDETNAWQDFSVMPYVNNDAPTPFINADAPTTPFWAPMSPATWYNVWLVIDNDAADPTFDLYYSTGSDAPALVIADADWRNHAGNVDLNAIGFMAAGQEFTEYYIDNIYFDSGSNLTNPVPEPSIALLGGLGLLGLLRRRR